MRAAGKQGSRRQDIRRTGYQVDWWIRGNWWGNPPAADKAPPYQNGFPPARE